MSLMHEMTVQLTNTISDGSLHSFLNHVTLDWHVLAQNITGPGIGERTQEAWSNFIETGQVWALIVGLALGYWFRYMTGG